MKTILLFGVILISLLSSIRAAPLQNLSEKLSSSGGDKTKEKVPNEETHIIEPNNDSNIENDENVEDLEKLKTHAASAADEKLEESLMKLHSHNKHPEEKPTKQFRGAARLAFGQNTDEATEAPAVSQQKEVYENLPLPDAIETSSMTAATKNGQRRSLKNDLTLNAASMLRHLNGKYSAYDMAQYIFWTGDEQGVAKAVEELIDEGVMSRENAIEFLNDIRLGIDYLENTYNLKHGETKNTIPFAHITPSTTSSTTEAPVDEIPFSYNYNYQKFHSLFKPSHKSKIHYDDDEAPTLSPAAYKALEKIPSLMKLTENQGIDNKQESTAASSSFDDEGGRSRLADFLYGEYSLEEVIYQLAKTMFTQSLTHGSEESQTALQKLTLFLESEGKHGRISPALQKKVLDVLLAALSDTLSENPDVLAKARHAMNEN